MCFRLITSFWGMEQSGAQGNGTDCSCSLIIIKRQTSLALRFLIYCDVWPPCLATRTEQPHPNTHLFTHQSLLPAPGQDTFLTCGVSSLFDWFPVVTWNLPLKWLQGWWPCHCTMRQESSETDIQICVKWSVINSVLSASLVFVGPHLC